jgi:HSP20 family protein
MAEKTVAAPQGMNGGHNLQAGREATRAQERYASPAVDIYETADGLVVLADLPGTDKEGVNIEVEDNILTISAQAKHALQSEPVHVEFELAGYFRQFQIADTVDTSKITAEFSNGVLKLQLPKAERLKPKQIAVQVG